MPTTSFTRSLINNSIAEAMAAFARFGVALPPWAFWSPADWADNVFLVDYGTRFPKIIEDEPRRYYLCHEYPVAGIAAKGSK